MSSQKAVAFATIGGDLFNDPVGVDQIETIESFAQLPRFRMPEVHAVSHSQVIGHSAQDRCLHLSGTFPSVEP